jgi:two-component system chemotaxis response regulator CheB
VLRPDNRAGIRQFRCHIGHVLTAETTLVAQFTVLEKKLAGSLALLNERAELCQQMGEEARKQGDGTSQFEAAAREALTRAEIIKKLLEDEWVQPLGEIPARGAAG